MSDSVSNGSSVDPSVPMMSPRESLSNRESPPDRSSPLRHAVQQNRTPSPFLPSPYTTQQQQMQQQQFYSPGAQSSNNTVQTSSNAGSFVRKLYEMVCDKNFQHLISYSFSGNSFVVCNADEFAKQVLPKHFKHNNFSSFVRQLNMYGFHKVNKTASRANGAGPQQPQVWEFSHPKFIKGREDLLDEIKRKVMDADTLRRDTGDLHAHIAMLQLTQSDMAQQMGQLQDYVGELTRTVDDSRKREQRLQEMVHCLLSYVGEHAPEFKLSYPHLYQSPTPTIYVTNANNATRTHSPMILNQQQQFAFEAQQQLLQSLSNGQTPTRRLSVNLDPMQVQQLNLDHNNNVLNNAVAQAILHSGANYQQQQQQQYQQQQQAGFLGQTLNAAQQFQQQAAMRRSSSPARSLNSSRGSPLPHRKHSSSMPAHMYSMQQQQRNTLQNQSNHSGIGIAIANSPATNSNSPAVNSNFYQQETSIPNTGNPSVYVGTLTSQALAALDFLQSPSTSKMEMDSTENMEMNHLE